MRNRIVTSAWMLALCVPTLVLAQQPRERGKGTWEFSAGGGVKVMDRPLLTYLSSGPVANRFTQDTDQGRIMPGIAGRIGYNFSRQFAFSVGGEASRSSGITYLTPLTALTFTPNMNARTSPFISLGSQVTRVAGENERRTHPTWGAHVGLGVRQMVSDNLSLRVEGKMASEHYSELPGRKSAYPGMATVSMSYFKGGPRPVVTAQAAPPIVRWRSDTVWRTRVDTVRIRTAVLENVDQIILRVQFKTNFAELLPISRPVLDTIAMAIIETPGSRWEVQGHTDNVGTPAENKYLSEERAKTVVEYLVSKGVNRGVLTAVGFGEERPVFANTTLYGRAQNRRVQLRRVPPPPTGQPVP